MATPIVERSQVGESPPPLLSIVIPAFNEERRLGRTLVETLSYLALQPYRSEVIVVDDGSSDGTAALVEKHVGSSGGRLRLIPNPRNRGKGFAVRSGVLHSRGEFILFFDADLSTPLVEVERVLDPLTSGHCEVVVGSRFGDRALFFRQSGLEELSGFGPIGMLAVATMLGAGFRWRPRQCWWQLAVAALVGVCLVSMTVAYSPWTNRYLISWYALGTVALVCALWERDAPWIPTMRWLYLAVVIVSVAAAPLQSFNRGPAALLAAVTDRERFETGTFPLVGKVRERLRRLRAQTPDSQVYFVVSDESVVLPILEDKQLEALLVTPTQFRRMAAQGDLARGDLVIQEDEMNYPFLTKIEEVSAPNVYSDQRTLTQWIYRVAEFPAAKADNAR